MKRRTRVDATAVRRNQYYGRITSDKTLVLVAIAWLDLELRILQMDEASRVIIHERNERGSNAIAAEHL